MSEEIIRELTVAVRELASSLNVMALDLNQIRNEIRDLKEAVYGKTKVSESSVFTGTVNPSSFPASPAGTDN